MLGIVEKGITLRQGFSKHAPLINSITENIFEMQILQPHQTPTDQKLWVWGPRSVFLCFNKHSR